MNQIILLLALLGADEFQWQVLDAPAFSWSISDVKGGGPSDLPVQDAQGKATDGLSSFVHRIDAANHSGSCVCIAPGVFVTAKHIFEGLSGYQVSIDGQAVAASVTFAPSHDVAIVSLTSETAAAPVETGDAAYLANCTAYGMFSKTVHAGLVSNDNTLSLTTDSGISLGDSGGGVFSDGKLVGVIRGRNPENHRVCFFTPMVAVAALIAPFSPETDSPSAPGADDKPVVQCFTQDNCGPCRQSEQRDWSSEKFAVAHSSEAPSWVQAFPCYYWKTKSGGWKYYYGFDHGGLRGEWERTQ